MTRFETPRVAVVGAGEIGRGWAALAIAAGWPVTIYDADADTLAPAADAIADRVVSLLRARRADPAVAEVAWLLPEGEHAYWRGRIASASYDYRECASAEPSPVASEPEEISLMEADTDLAPEEIEIIKAEAQVLAGEPPAVDPAVDAPAPENAKADESASH